MCVVNVASYDNYMLINSYLTFCFLLFSMTTLLQLGVHIHETQQVSQTLKKCPACFSGQFFQVHSLTEKQWKTMLN